MLRAAMMENATLELTERQLSEIVELTFAQLGPSISDRISFGTSDTYTSRAFASLGWRLRPIHQRKPNRRFAWSGR